MDKNKVSKYFEDEVVSVPMVVLEFPLHNIDPLDHLPIYLDFCSTFTDIIEPKDVLIWPIHLQEYIFPDGGIIKDIATDCELDFKQIKYTDFANIDKDGLKKFFEYEEEIGIRSLGAYNLDIYLKLKGDVIILSNYHSRVSEILPEFYKDGLSFFNMLENRYIIHSFEIESFTGEDARFITAQITFESNVLWINDELAKILQAKIDYLVIKGWIIRKTPLLNKLAQE